MAGNTRRSITRRRIRGRAQHRPSLTKATVVLAAAVAMIVSLAGVAGAQTDATITPDGIGNAVIGSSANQLRGQLGAGWLVEATGEFLVDIEGYEVSKHGVVQFFAGRSLDIDDLSDDTPLPLFVVSQPGLKTATGIGVDSTVADGIAAYGDATVFTSEIESRQFTSFADGPDRVQFRTENAGDYGDDNELGEAPAVNPDGVITQIWISCPPAATDCPEVPGLVVTGIGVSGVVAVGLGLMALGLGLWTLDRRMRRRKRTRPEWVADW